MFKSLINTLSKATSRAYNKRAIKMNAISKEMVALHTSSLDQKLAALRVEMDSLNTSITEMEAQAK